MRKCYTILWGWGWHNVSRAVLLHRCWTKSQQFSDHHRNQYLQGLHKSIREAAKKIPPLMAGPLRGGGGKGRAIKEKNFFWNFFFNFVTTKKWKLFYLGDLSKYGNITLKFAGRYFYLLVTIFPKNRAILVQKLLGEKKLSKTVFGYFKTKKKQKKSSDGH